MRRPRRPWSQRKLRGIATLEEESGWQTLLQVAQDFTTHVCEGLPYVLHCAKMREGSGPNGRMSVPIKSRPHRPEMRLPLYPESGHSLGSPSCLKSANNRLMHRSKQHRHSITSSARSSSEVGTSTLSAFAVLRFTTSSNLVGCSTGRSPGFAPLKILSMKTATRRNRSCKFAP
jgi:hypothetical protein